MDRLEKLKEQEQRDRARREAQRHGAQVIVEQIRERHTKRMNDEEQRDLDRAHVLRQLEALKEDEEAQAVRKQADLAKLIGEVHQADHASALIKAERARAEK